MDEIGLFSSWETLKKLLSFTKWCKFQQLQKALRTNIPKVRKTPRWSSVYSSFLSISVDKKNAPKDLNDTFTLEEAIEATSKYLTLRFLLWSWQKKNPSFLFKNWEISNLSDNFNGHLFAWRHHRNSECELYLAICEMWFEIDDRRARYSLWYPIPGYCAYVAFLGLFGWYMGTSEGSIRCSIRCFYFFIPVIHCSEHDFNDSIAISEWNIVSWSVCECLNQ